MLIPLSFRIWIIYFVDTMQQGMTNSLTAYVTSSFNQHSLLGATSIMSSIIGGLVKLPLAKVLDIWGRPHGYFMMVCCLTLGLVMMAGCNNVQTYAAAQVFYWVGYVAVAVPLFSETETNTVRVCVTDTTVLHTLWEFSSPTRLRSRTEL